MAEGLAKRGANVVLLADLLSQAQARRAASEFQARHDRLHVLVNNVMALPRTGRVTVDGIEESLAVNHLSHFLLTNLLLPQLNAAAPSRVVTVTTSAHAKKLDLDDLRLERGHAPFTGYARSKLLNVLFTYEPARRPAGTGVTSNAVHPANMILSGGTRELQGAWRVLFGLLRPFHATPEAAAREPLRVATDPSLESVTGRFFANGQERRSAPITYDETLARRVWDESAKLVGLAPQPPTSATR